MNQKRKEKVTSFNELTVLDRDMSVNDNNNNNSVNQSERIDCCFKMC